MAKKIEKLDHQGRGIIKENGKVIFVENALPDEMVTVAITKSKRNIEEADVLHYEKTSPDRIVPACPYYKLCGGCHIMHLSYEKQLEWKKEKLMEILSKFMDKEIFFPILPILASEPFHYRNKAVFHIDKKLGYYQKKSNIIVSIEACDLVDFKINDLLRIIQKLDIDDCSQVTIRVSQTEAMVIFTTEKQLLKDIIERLRPYVDSIYVQGKECKLVYGKPAIQETIGDYIFEISPESFFQVNTKQAKKLYDMVLKYADVKVSDCVLDLYCGTGTIGLYISSNCKHVLGVEVNRQAIEDAKRNQILNGIKNVDFICGDVSKIVKQMKENYDVVIVDPPRNGLDEATIFYLKTSRAKRIIYVSCDPVTLARDLNLLKEKYIVKELTPIDMFPNTYHLESVCVLNRR